MTGMIEKVYSKALFEIGVDDNSLDDLYGEVSQLAEIFITNPELPKLLSTPTITLDEKFALLSRLFGGKLSQDGYSFLCILVEKHRADKLEKIAGEFKRLYNEHNGIMEIIVTTAEPLKPTLKEKLVDKLHTNTGKRIELVEKVDKALLGGIVISYGNTQMDASVKSRLEALSAQLKGIIS